MISGLNVGTHFRKLLRGVLPPLALIAITPVSYTHLTLPTNREV